MVSQYPPRLIHKIHEVYTKISTVATGHWPIIGRQWSFKKCNILYFYDITLFEWPLYLIYNNSLGMTQLDCARIGTAGYTAALCVEALVSDGIKPEDGKIVVSGATGGVGSVAVALLANMGYSVCINCLSYYLFSK